MKRIMAFLLSLCVLSVFAPCLPVFAENEILIGTLDELISFRDAVNNGNSFIGQTVRLTADIDLKGSEENPWTPIGMPGYPFSGTFDGGGYGITGLYINTSSDYQGFFGYICGATYDTVKNLSVYGNIAPMDGPGAEYCGGIVGYLDYGKIENCNVSVNILGRKYIGGIAGYTSACTIKNCYNKGSITSFDGYGGGIVGYRYGGENENCYNTGDILIFANGDSIENGSVVGFGGGIVGYVNSDPSSYPVKNCYHIGNFIYHDSSFEELIPYVYCIAGGNVTIENCFCISGCGSSNGATELTEDQFFEQEIFTDAGWDFDSVWEMSDAFGRPILQSKYSADYIEISNKAELKNFANAVNYENDIDFAGKTVALTADIDLEGNENNQWTPIGNNLPNRPEYQNSYFSGTFDGNNHKITGLYIDNDWSVDDWMSNLGLFGETSYDGVTIKNLGVDGYVKGYSCIGGIAGKLNSGSIINCSSSATVMGSEYVGGIVGDNWDGVVENCYNQGNIIGAGGDYIGGIAGENGKTVKNCYNTGTVTGTSSYADYVGGIVGINYSNEASLEKCYNIGEVKTESSTKYMGGVSGYGSRVKNCFYLTGSAATDSSATELTAEQFANINTFADAGWDFDSVWKMSKAFKRPILQDNSEFATPTFGIGETDSGSYQTVDAETLGVIRFLQEYSGEEVSSYGFYFVNIDGEIINNSEIKAEGSFDTDGFYGDLTDIRPNDLNNYYAKPFVTVNDDIYMGKSIPGTVDWERAINYPDAEK